MQSEYPNAECSRSSKHTTYEAPVVYITLVFRLVDRGFLGRPPQEAAEVHLRLFEAQKGVNFLSM